MLISTTLSTGRGGGVQQVAATAKRKKAYRIFRIAQRPGRPVSTRTILPAGNWREA
jgi:hypothetical protein